MLTYFRVHDVYLIKYLAAQLSLISHPLIDYKKCVVIVAQSETRADYLIVDKFAVFVVLKLIYVVFVHALLIASVN